MNTPANKIFHINAAADTDADDTCESEWSEYNHPLNNAQPNDKAPASFLPNEYLPKWICSLLNKTMS